MNEERWVSNRIISWTRNECMTLRSALAIVMKDRKNELRGLKEPMKMESHIDDVSKRSKGINILKLLSPFADRSLIEGELGEEQQRRLHRIMRNGAIVAIFGILLGVVVSISMQWSTLRDLLIIAGTILAIYGLIVMKFVFWVYSNRNEKGL